MKNSIADKMTSVFLTLILAFGFIPSTAFAQTNPNPSSFSDVKGFNKPVFDLHFSRADRELNPDRWLAEAKWGVTQALYAWEIIASGLYENPFLLEEAKNQIEKWSNEELEARFSQWLIGRFFGAAEEEAAAELSAMLGETQKNYSWRMDDEGNVIFDDKTGDPLVVRPGDTGREFSQDLEKWRNETESHVITNISSVNTVITRSYPELLAYIPAELRETMSAVIHETGASVSEAIKREFENIAAREERVFTGRRTRDIWSLRKKSDDEAARIFTEKLINETEGSCAKGIEELKTRIEEASAGTGDLALLGEEWLQLYREQFERGLKAWEEAEERFFIRRIEWEQDSFRMFSEGEEIWLAAFNQFEEERQRWELKAKELFRSGELLFKNISDDSEKNIAEAKAEFEYNTAMRIGAGTTKAKALVDMYLVCGSAAISAKQNIQFWQEQCKGISSKEPDDPGFMDWLLHERKIIWVKAEAHFNALPVIKKPFNSNSILLRMQDIIAGKMTAAEEITFAKQISHLNIISVTNLESLFEMEKSYNLYISYLAKATETRDRILADYGELIGTGALKDILAPDASSEDFCLDEYQIALIRAKTLVLYWERKTSIAESVMAYAVELNAGRMTEAEGLRAWEDAKAAYNESLAQYETELLRLNAIGADIQKKQAALDNLALKMKNAEEKLSNLNKEYSSLIAANGINRENFLLLDFNTKYDFLAEEYRHLTKTGEASVYKSVLDYGISWGIAEQREIAESALAGLVNGDGAEMPSLATLEKNVLEGIDSEISLKVRLVGMDLLQMRSLDSPYSGADWYFKAKGLIPTVEEKAALYGEKLHSRLVTDLKNSSRILIEKRIALELQALDCFLDVNSAPGSDGYALSQFSLIDAQTGARVYEIMLRLQERLQSGKGYYIDDSSAGDKENDIVSFFVSGGSFFAGSEQYLAAYFDEYIFCLGLLDVYNNYAAISSFAPYEIWRDTCGSLKELLSGFDLTRIFVPDAQSVCDFLFQKPGDFINNAAEFLLEFEKCFLLIPQWLEIELNNWKTAMIEYIASFALCANVQPSKKSPELALEHDELEAKYAQLHEYAGSLLYIDDSEVEKINDAFANMDNEKFLLFYMYQITAVWEKLIEKNSENEIHWRQFLSNDYLQNYDPAVTGASSWKEGAMLDALDNVAYFTNRLNDSFALYSQKDTGIPGGNAKLFYSLYSDEASKVNNRLYSMKSQCNEIARAGRAYEFSQMSRAEARAELEAQYTAIKTQEEIFDVLRSGYFLEAATFNSIGILYDNHYSILKRAYDDAEKKRFEYETQDAIRRWASTAYLNIDTIDTGNCKNKLEKAQTVLAVLSSIYTDEDRRSYNNGEYDALYAEYQQSFGIKLKVLEAFEIVASASAQEQINNEKIYSQYQNSLNNLGQADHNYSNYLSPASGSLWSVKDIVTVKDGRLAFSRDGSMTLSGVNAAKANSLDNYFAVNMTPDGEYIAISQFEQALRGLNMRMTDYFTDAGRFKQWSLARDYLLFSLMQANKDLRFLADCYSGPGEMRNGGSLGSLPYIRARNGKAESLYSAFVYGFPGLINAESAYSNAWNNLGAEEKADLEFYVILTLFGNCNDYIAGFSLLHTLDVYKTAYDMVDTAYSTAKKEADKWWNVFTFRSYFEMRDVDNSTRKRIQPVITETEGIIQKWTQGLGENLKAIQSYASAYAKSCNVLNILNGTPEPGKNAGWEEISFALLETKKIKSEDIAVLKTCWDKMQMESGGAFQSAAAALAGLVRWARDAENRSKQALENRWLADEQNRLTDEYNYHKAEEAYIAGTIDAQTLKIAADKAFGKNAAAWKNHLEKMENSLLGDLSLYLDCEFDFSADFSVLGDEIAYLAARTLDSRYRAELAARETEWNQIREDIKEKHIEWLDSAAGLLENGRADWNAGIQKMEESYRQWNINFQKEYNRVSDEWAEAYLAGLEDKEKWLEQAATAANQASSESFLPLIGIEGERLSRFVDTREPFGIRDAIPTAENLLSGLLQASGTSNMINAFNSLNNAVSIASLPVRRGMGGVAIWDAALAKTAASDLARKTNAELAAGESRKLARNARLAADEAIKNLAASVDSANRNFRENMDNTFIFHGLWRRSGNNYVKDIIKGSTLFQPVISEKKTVSGYVDYSMEPITLTTNMDENYLAGLDSLVIMGLVESVYLEVEATAKEIFGTGSGSVKINKQTVNQKKVYKDSQWTLEDELITLEEREQSPGKFGSHLGYSPAAKPQNQMGRSRNSIFYDEGAGELGRLLTEYIYWSVIDGRGSAELGLAAWDKRMWDDSGSFFTAPTLRTTVKTAGSIAATVVSVAATPLTGGASIAGIIGMTALTAGISSTGDLAFAALDAAYGYKTFDEAAFEWGKASLINAATSVGSGLFSGIGGAGTIASQGLTGAATNAAGSATGKLLVQTAMTGVQTVTTTLAASAISGITYSHEKGWGYSSETFNAGVSGMYANVLSSMAGAFTAGTLQTVNSGIAGEKLAGFSNINKGNLSRLNSLAGSLAGQGVNYAMGNDFTLNVLNLGLFTGGEINSGLLELHIGRDGTAMNIGTGGANVSIDNLIGAYKGAMVWNVNNQIGKYTSTNIIDINAALRAQYGFGDTVQTGQLWDILKGRDEIQIDDSGNYTAQTVFADGKRTINLSGYHEGMSLEEQMRLAVILGHEAYRDGRKIGDMDEYGSLITQGDNFAELKEASIARIMMGERINQDYQWFYNANTDFEFENIMLKLADTFGDYALFDDYLRFAYNNDEDYFWQWASSRNDFQNMDRYRNIPLFNAKSAERVAELNTQNLEIAFEKYKADLAEKEGYTGDIAAFVSREGTDDVLRSKLNSSVKLQDQFGYTPLKFESIYMVGCMFMSTKYGLEAITGKKIDTIAFHEYIKENNLYRNESDLSNVLMAKIMTSFSRGQFYVSLAETGLPDPARLNELGQSDDMYLAHIRIKKDGTGDGYHSEMVSGIEYIYDSAGKIIGISAISTANPWNGGNSFTGRTSYTMDQIARWDIFKVTPLSPAYGFSTVSNLQRANDPWLKKYY